MKAAIVPSVNSRWEIQEVPTPEPGPGQVLIKIHASGLCYTDVHQTRGELPGPFPRTLGHEPVGEIVGIGVGVSTRRVGDRVGVPWIQTTCGRCEWCLRGRPMFCPEQIGTSSPDVGRPRRVHARLRRRHDAPAGGHFLRAGGADLLCRLHGLVGPALGRSQAGRTDRGGRNWRARPPGGPVRQGRRLRDDRGVPFAGEGQAHSASSAPMRSSAMARV